MNWKIEYDLQKENNKRLKKENRRLRIVSYFAIVIFLLILIMIIVVDNHRYNAMTQTISNHYKTQLYTCDNMYQDLLSEKCDYSVCEKQLNTCNTMYTEATSGNNTNRG